MARNIRLGGGRAIQLRAELFNAFNSVIITGRNTTMNIATLQTPGAAVNLPYDPATGALVSGRDLPRSAGFGVATSAANPRNVQLQVRFQF